MDKRTYLLNRYEWRDETYPHLANVGVVEVEVTVDWDKLRQLADRAVYTKKGKAIAYNGAIKAKVVGERKP